MGLIITQIVALSPSSLDQSSSQAKVPQQTLAEDLQDEGTLATNVPKGKIPEYTVEGFNFVSTQGGEKQWKLDAKRAFLFNSEKLVHARQVTAYLYGSDGKITVVTGDEAQYFMNKRDLEIFGHVKTRFPDGFETLSEYMRYLPQSKKVEIPMKYVVNGQGQEDKGQEFHFKSQGLYFEMLKSDIVLPAAVKFTLKRLATLNHPAENTTIESDRCVIHRLEQLAHFTMNAERPLATRFVRINQPTLYAQSRRADVNYGNFDKLLQYMTAFEDVLIRETGSGSSLRYGTGGRADFDAHRDVIVLKEFPQVYQDNDTVTGDIILVHRDTDIVEVEHSNAFSEGESQSSKPRDGTVGK